MQKFTTIGLLARHDRLVLQPTVAAILGFRAGLRDARQKRPPFFWAVFFKATSRRELLRQGWKDAGRVFILATILDVVYQLIVHRGVYVLELLITVVTLAILPYILVRGRSQHVFDERDFLPDTKSANRQGTH